MLKQDINYNSQDGLVLGVGTQTDSVVPTAGTAYQRGDLLVIAEDTNAATHSIDAKDWHVVCLADVTAQQADDAISEGVEIPVYTQGELNVEVCKINGTALTDAQQKTARAHANRMTAIELRKPTGA